MVPIKAPESPETRTEAYRTGRDSGRLVGAVPTKAPESEVALGWGLQLEGGGEELGLLLGVDAVGAGGRAP